MSLIYEFSQGSQSVATFSTLILDVACTYWKASIFHTYSKKGELKTLPENIFGLKCLNIFRDLKRANQYLICIALWPGTL